MCHFALDDEGDKVSVSVENAEKWGDVKSTRKIVKNLSMFDAEINGLIFKVIILDRYLYPILYDKKYYHNILTSVI